MMYDRYGRIVVSIEDICELLYQDPSIKFDKFLVEDPTDYNRAIKYLHYNATPLEYYANCNGDITVEEFDSINQTKWFMPEKYQNFDIAQWLYDQCQTDEEMDRVGQELLQYHNRNLIPLLQYLKFLVDTMRDNNIVWGVGRGSSVASYILYLIGVHKINSLAYELSIDEFFK